MCRKSRSELGFTLIEATISMTLLLVVLIISTMFFISMRTFSQRQEMFTAPRQTARRVVDYITTYIVGASDMNTEKGRRNPDALLIHYNDPQIQASYDNLAAAQANLGDPGTDIINVQVPTSNVLINILTWPGGKTASDLWVEFGVGCPNSALNLQLFQSLTGYDPATGKSGTLTLIDSDGGWSFYQITNYLGVDCAATPPQIHVGCDPGLSNGINPPGGQPDLTAPKIATTAFTCFRVMNRQLQQKNGIFTPASPNAGFYTLMDNVEDFQVAYIYNDGTVWNTASQTLATPFSVPPQLGTAAGAPTAQDVSNVAGLRISLVARSGRLPVTILNRDKYIRPAVENRAAGAPDRFYHYRLTATVMLRNRMLGG